MGLHPTSVNDNPAWREDLQLVEEYLENSPVGQFCGVGEIGLDFYWSSDFRAEQMEAFERQIELSLRYNLPIAVHTRSAWAEMCEVIEGFRGRGVKGVFHAFSDGVETFARLRECGDFMFGIGGVVTFKKSPLAEVVREIPLAELLLETDCPYLTPVPFRGQRNESAYIPYICEKIAEIKGVSVEEVAMQTTLNAERMFLNSR
jgi:TatD DNase family protein